MMRKITYIFVFILLSLLTNLYAESASLSGFVTDSTSGEGLIGANVYLQDLPIGISTNYQGYYVLHPLPAGSYLLKVSYLGYRTYETSISLSEGQKLFLNISLLPQAVEGEEVVVSAEALTKEREIRISQV